MSRRLIFAGFVVCLLAPPLAQAMTFRCGAGDVPCLIAAMNTANANGQQHNTIILAAGTYSLTAVDNSTDGPNGLPSMSGHLTISGDSAETTIIERDSTLPPLTEPSLRLFHIADTGTLRLEQLTVRGGSLADSGQNDALFGAGIRNAGGRLVIRHSVITDNTGIMGKGGAGIFNTNGIVIITHSTLAGNVAQGSHGGSR
jgi:nitrous oxidase accessory protein NosD